MRFSRSCVVSMGAHDVLRSRSNFLPLSCPLTTLSLLHCFIDIDSDERASFA